ncbi:MAG: hypothetical protein CVU63_02550 [Deltaproteobacteria bacterium HGW-Deltaproteobacteria-20]|nr:MAG: hypothetical protein CVU63_02550 [Deltaproteobacteria bacterium HGW-Deltaproteobacteria-20]
MRRWFLVVGLVGIAFGASSAMANNSQPPRSAPSAPKRPVRPAIGNFLAPALVVQPVPANTYADTPVTLQLKLRNFKADSSVAVTSVGSQDPTCVFKVRTSTAMPSGNATRDGFSFSLAGMFSNPGPDPTGPCRVVLHVRGTDLTGKPLDQAVSVDGIRLAQPATYVVTNTSDWLSKLRFTLIEQRGTCTGYSSSLVGESFRVGLIDNDGSGFPPPDITTKIRSGPSGTTCRWRSQPLLLPQGVKLVDMRVSTSISGDCKVFLPGTTFDRSASSAAAYQPAVGFRSEDDPVKSPSGDAVAPNANGAGLPANGLGLEVRLKCNATLSNDRFATLVIDSMTFVGPPGLTFP